MEIHHLRTLRELRDRGSVTAVAEALHLSPSAVSQQLAVLQRSAPVPLTRRQGRRLVLTEAGERLASAGQEVFTALAGVRSVLESLTDEPGQPVSVSAFHSAALVWFPALATSPGPAIRCTDLDVTAPGFVAATGDVDIVIAHRAAHEDVWPDTVVVEPLLVEPFDIAVRTGHPSAGDLSPETLGDLDWIGVHGDYPLAAYLDLIAAHCGRPLRVVHRINEYPTAAELVARTDAAALLPRFTGPTRGDGSGLTLHSLPGLNLVRHIDALVRPESLARPAVRTVLDRLHHIAREVQAR